MIFKNLLRRKGRTLLTALEIGIGVAAIITLGALANGVEQGYRGMMTGSRADLILSQPDAYDLSLSSLEESIGPELAVMPEVTGVSGMVQGIVQAEDQPYFFVFGYPADSFVLGRFQIVEGVGPNDHELRKLRGTPIWIGTAAAEALNKQVGDALRINDSTYRVAGIYSTGEALEDGGSILLLEDAQTLLGQQRHVSAFYIQIEQGAENRERLEARIARRWPDLLLSTTADLASRSSMVDSLRAFMWAISGLAIVIGGVGMMNAQLMSVFERTREIGVLRAVGWSRWRVMAMIVGESVLVGLAGGVAGLGIGWLLLSASSAFLSAYGASTASVTPGLLIQAFAVVVVLGMTGGLYPAWRASRLEPVEALRYEGGSLGKRAIHLPVGGMAAQGLWQRKARTTLTLGAIGLTVGAIMALDGIAAGFSGLLEDLAGGAEIIIREAGVSDTGYSALDERVGEQIAAMPEVENVAGLAVTAITMPETGFFVILGRNPREAAMRNYHIVEGQAISTNHQIMLGRQVAEALNRDVGDTITLSGTRFRIVGIYTSSSSWEEIGGVVTLRDAQAFSGRPRKVTLYQVWLRDSRQAEEMVARINARFPEAHAALAGEFAEQMPDMQSSRAMINGISIMAVLVGGFGLMNTMLMAVLERTREIGVLRALGWRARAVLGLILRESVLLGVLGAIVGILVAFGLAGLLGAIPLWGTMLVPLWSWQVFARAISVALGLGIVGGLYPAFRATRLQPVEALRYE